MSFDPEIDMDVATFCKLNANYVADVWTTLGGEVVDKEALAKVLLKFFNRPFEDLMEQIMNLKTYDKK